MAPSTVILGGTVDDGSLIGLNGYVEASLSNDLVDSVDKLIIQSSTIRIPVVDGVLTPTLLVANNDPHVTPGSVWNITHKIRGVPVKGPYPIQILTTDGPTVDLSSKTPAAPVAPLPGVALLNSGVSGQVLVSQGNFQAQWQNQVSGGTVVSVNNQPPDGAGNVSLTASQVGADSAGAAATAQTNAVAAAASSAAGLYLRLTDPSVTNARTPTLHAASHAVGGGDPVTPDAIGALSAGVAQMLGYGLLTADPRLSTVTYQQTPGDFVLCLCTPAKSKTISTLEIWVTAAGVTGSGTNALYLYDELGNQIDMTGDLTATFSSTGMLGGAMGSSHMVTVGINFYVGFLTHFSGSSPHFAATGTTQTANFPVMNGHRLAIFKSGVANAPTNFDPSTFTPNSGYFILGAR